MGVGGALTIPLTPGWAGVMITERCSSYRPWVVGTEDVAVDHGHQRKKYSSTTTHGSIFISPT